MNKTKLVHFRQRDTAALPCLDIQYNNNKIDEIDSTKFLGLYIDKKLNWKAHIEYLCKKINSLVYILYKLSHVVNVETLLVTYHGLIASNLRYAILFWGNSTDFDKVFKCQKRCVRAMFRLKVMDSCEPYFARHSILTLPSLYIYETAMFVKNNPDLYCQLADAVPRNRRDQHRVCKPNSKTTLMRKSIFCMAPSIYNKLPKSLRELPRSLFQRKLKATLERKCYYKVNDFMADKCFGISDNSTMTAS